MLAAKHKGHEFTDKDVVDLDSFIPAGEYNPYNVRPWLIYHEYGTMAVVFASCEQDALDSAVDNDKMNSCAISAEDLAKMSDDERDDLAYLGNAGEPFNLDYVGMVELPTPPASFVAMFNARQ